MANKSVQFSGVSFPQILIETALEFPSMEILTVVYFKGHRSFSAVSFDYCSLFHLRLLFYSISMLFYRLLEIRLVFRIDGICCAEGKKWSEFGQSMLRVLFFSLSKSFDGTEHFPRVLNSSSSWQIDR